MVTQNLQGNIQRLNSQTVASAQLLERLNRLSNTENVRIQSNHRHGARPPREDAHDIELELALIASQISRIDEVTAANEANNAAANNADNAAANNA